MNYIYAYLDPRKPGKHVYDDIIFDYLPFYIGMSKNKNRKFNHINDSIKNKKGRNKRKIELIQKLIKNKLEPIIITLYENLSNTEALNKEVELIEKIGRVNIKTGPLLNVLPGGQPIESEIISLKLKKNKRLNSDKKLKVIQIDLNGNLIKEWDSATTASNILKINRITSCCRGERKTAGGYKWIYKEPENRIKRKVYKKRLPPNSHCCSMQVSLQGHYCSNGKIVNLGCMCDVSTVLYLCREVERHTIRRGVLLLV